jgi:ADP-ribosyl-[dinitrogen reductase] hydrolase
MLVEMALGDSYGAPFEFIKPARALACGLVNDTKTYQHHPEFSLGGGRYTDDTQMALAISELMLESPDGLDAKVLADRFVSTFKRDERKGYGSRFYDLLMEVNDGAELLERLKPDSARSGACMRAGPIGLYGSTDMVFAQAKLQASITHNTPEGIMAAQAIAMMTHFFVCYRQGDTTSVPAPLGSWLEQYVPGYDWSKDWTGPTTVMAIPCAHAAITAVKNGKSYRQVLEQCIAFGGDVDTIAAMAMFAVSLTDLPNDLPLELYENLENGTYGREYLMGMDARLKTFARTQGANLP